MMSNTLVVLLLATGAAPAPADAPFEMPASLMPTVGFWARVYGEWSSHHVVIHDATRVEVIYRVLDLGEFEPVELDSTLVRQKKASARATAVLDARAELDAALHELAAQPPPSAAGLTGVQREAFLAWDSLGLASAQAFEQAHPRAQRGLADKFAHAVHQSGRFLGAVQQALRQANLPEGLVALAFTESLMEVHARSASGAVGPWQFLAGTGREYLALNAVVDERRDPVLSSVAAGRYLNNSKQRLGGWGVAITAYNYGTNGMARAVAQLGTSDVETVLRDYHTSRFGFAARNYYAEFLATLHVLSHAGSYFPGVKPVAPWAFDAVALPRRARATELWSLGVPKDAVKELNPALTTAALSGGVALEKGLTLRLPRGTGENVLAALRRGSAPGEALRSHTLKRGETLMAVARRYHVTLGELCGVNNVDPQAHTAVGQKLLIPNGVSFSVLPEARAAAKAGGVASVVFPRPVVLSPFAAVLANARPTREPVVLAFESGLPKTVPTVVASKKRDLVLASVAPGSERALAAVTRVVDSLVCATLGRPVTRAGRRGMVLAGPVFVSPWGNGLDGAGAVDALADALALPDVDVATGNPAGAQPWSPAHLPVAPSGTTPDT